jgi:glycosyltransferase involved in cell wall biosynthesis
MAGWDAGLAPYLPADRFWFSPLKLLEYMAAGACPVASEVGEVAGTLGYGARGVLVPAGNVAALAAALAMLAKDRLGTQALGARARRWVGANRPWSANARWILEAIGGRSVGVPA